MCFCTETDEKGNWLHPPCCDNGFCESDATDKNATYGSCEHCGADMFKENGYWWHYSQEEIPLEERGKSHLGI